MSTDTSSLRNTAISALGILFLALISLSLVAEVSHAKPRKPKKKFINVTKNPSILYQIEFKQGRNDVEGHCFGKKPGKLITRKNGQQVLWTYAGMGKYYKKLAARAKTPKSRKKNLKKSAKFRRYNKSSKKQCNGQSRDLDPYRGNYGVREARILYKRFAFGGTPAEIAWSVSVGLNRTVETFLTPLHEPRMEAYAAEYECDARPASHPDNRSCDPREINDLSTTGLRYGWLGRAIQSKNRFRYAEFLRLHSIFATSTDAAPGCARYATRAHMNLIFGLADNGDYATFLNDLEKDVLMLYWLDGNSNKGSSPNENYARELWELFSLGDEDGHYGPVDVAQSARAHSGWVIDYQELFEDYYVCSAGYHQLQHAEGPKYIFQGPYRTQVENAEDVVRATLAHPATAQRMARLMLEYYVAPNPSQQTVNSLATTFSKKFNMRDALRVVMKSRALFSEANEDSILRTPIQKFLTLFVTTGMKPNVEQLDGLLRDNGQVILDPPSVFGWNRREQNKEHSIMNFRRAAMYILRDRGFQEENGWDPQSLVTANMTPDQAIQAIAGRMMIKLTPAQLVDLRTFLLYRLNGDDEYERDPFDPHPDNAENTRWKLERLIYLLLTSPNFQVQ